MKRALVLIGGSLVALAVVGLAVAGLNRNYSVHATGDLEVPIRDTQAQGQAIFHVSADGTSIDYKLIASNIENITQGHIHLRANAGVPTGGIVVWLYPSAPPAQLIPGRHDGVLAEGSITEDDFVNALDGASMETLVAALESGLAYANVHTTANPPGEIRGDIR